MPKHNCCAWKCSNSSDKQKQSEKYPNLATVTFHPFPRDNPNKYYAPGMTEQKRRKRWITECRLKSLKVNRNTRICSVHFEGGHGPTKANPIPTVFDFPKHLKRKTPPSRSDPEKRRQRAEMQASAMTPTLKTPKSQTSKKKLCVTLDAEISDGRVDGENIPEAASIFENENESDGDVGGCLGGCCPIYKEMAVQTDLTVEDIDLMEQAKLKLNNKTELKRELFIEDVCANDRSVKFYTGLPSLVCLHMLFGFIKPFAEKMKYWDGKKKTRSEAYQEEERVDKPGPKRRVPLFAEFILILVRLRLGLLVKHLSHMFSITEGSVSKIYTTWINLLYHILKSILIVWPSRKQVQKHLPKSFSKFPRTRVIIDCTELKVQKPTGPSAQKITWSDYKSSNTFKLLVGISPTGAFTFLSKLWSGGVSDRNITMKSGLIDKLEPNDDLMADRGFNIRDLVTKRMATLNIPPFSKGKPLSTKACTKTRRIAAVRIHVERAIQRLKGFRILQGVMPISLAAVADQTVIVCAALCNLMRPLVS